MSSSRETQGDWEVHRVTRRHAQRVYVVTEQALDEQRKALLANSPSPRKWWSTVKTAVFGASSSLSPLINRGSRLAWSAKEKASLFSAHFEANSVKIFQQPYFCDPSPVLCSLAFRSSSIRRLLLDLNA